MRSRKDNPEPLNVTRRGRPEFSDRTKLKTCTMTICLLPETKKALKKLADKHSQKTAAMARILIESGVDAA